MALGLLASEPALAQDNHLVPPMSERTQQELLSFFDETSPGTNGIALELLNTSATDSSEELTIQDIAQADLEHGQPIICNADTRAIKLQRTIPLTDLPVTDASWQTSQAHDATTTQITYIDQYRNGVRIQLVTHTNQDTATEIIQVAIPFHYATPGESAKTLPLQVDLSQAGNVSIAGGVYLQEVPYVGMVGQLPVYSADFTQAQAYDLLSNQAQDKLEWGINVAANSYGLKTRDVVKRVHLVDTGFAQASIDARQPNTLIVRDQLLVDPTVSPEDIRHVGVHETSHLVDNQLHISSDPRFVALFNRLTPAIKEQFNEDRFDDLFGGHAVENASELYASFLSGMDDASGFEETLNSKSAQFRDAYLDVAQTVRVILLDKGIAADAPIITDLEARIAFLK